MQRLICKRLDLLMGSHIICCRFSLSSSTNPLQPSARIMLKTKVPISKTKVPLN